ncbi:hypothetical protein ACOSQ2_017875 [Xanthoceras sorbifolium]
MDFQLPSRERFSAKKKKKKASKFFRIPVGVLISSFFAWKWKMKNKFLLQYHSYINIPGGSFATYSILRSMIYKNLLATTACNTTFMRQWSLILITSTPS